MNNLLKPLLLASMIVLSGSGSAFFSDGGIPLTESSSDEIQYQTDMTRCDQPKNDDQKCQVAPSKAAPKTGSQQSDDSAHEQP